MTKERAYFLHFNLWTNILNHYRYYEINSNGDNIINIKMREVDKMKCNGVISSDEYEKVIESNYCFLCAYNDFICGALIKENPTLINDVCPANVPGKGCELYNDVLNNSSKTPLISRIEKMRDCVIPYLHLHLHDIEKKEETDS